MWHVYILRCGDGSLYLGHTQDLGRRVQQPATGRGSVFTASRRPVVLAYAEPVASGLAAVRRERQLKRWTRRKKEALIVGDLELLKRL